ncbi:MAG: tetratricopeptide repeat protein, partial [Nonomuraea sp.]|nr:tetratricopeptide repeat protein [Nonomuraea sp.]
MDERIQHAKLLYESAVFAADEAALDTADSELDAVEADLALARGRIAHGRFLQRGTEYDPELFERALRLYRAADDLRGQAEALFWLGIFHQLVRRDDTTAVPSFSRSRELAAKSGDSLTLSYALRHLGIAEQRAGHLGTARDLLEESTRLRRELGFLPGVAA